MEPTNVIWVTSCLWVEWKSVSRHAQNPAIAHGRLRNNDGTDDRDLAEMAKKQDFCRSGGQITVKRGGEELYQKELGGK